MQSGNRKTSDILSLWKLDSDFEVKQSNVLL